MVRFVQNEQGPGPELSEHIAQPSGVDLITQQAVEIIKRDPVVQGFAKNPEAA